MQIQLEVSLSGFGSAVGGGVMLMAFAARLASTCAHTRARLCKQAMQAAAAH